MTTKKFIPKLASLLLVAVILIAGCEDLFDKEPDPDDPVYIPDSEFLKWMIEEGTDSNGDSLISYAEAKNVGVMDLTQCSGYNCHPDILSLEGIHAFVNLNTLIFDFQLEEIDLSNNINLKYLVCEGTGLTSLDVSNCKYLKQLDCRNNKLTTLDLTDCVALRELLCSHNELVDLNVSYCNYLGYLHVGNNAISNLELNNNYALTFLNCSNNELTYLDVSENTALKEFDCGGNFLSMLNISNNKNLKRLIVDEMPTLELVCVWTMPFPSYNQYYVEVSMDNSPNVFFTDECNYN